MGSIRTDRLQKRKTHSTIHKKRRYGHNAAITGINLVPTNFVLENQWDDHRKKSNQFKIFWKCWIYACTLVWFMSICTIPWGPDCLRNKGVGVGLHMVMLLNPSKAPGRLVSLLIFSTVKVNRDLSREHTDRNKHPLPTNQRWFYIWTSSDGQYWNQIDYILCSWRWRSSIQSAKTRPGAHCCLDHELLID